MQLTKQMEVGYGPHEVDGGYLLPSPLLQARTLFSNISSHEEVVQTPQDRSCNHCNFSTKWVSERVDLP
jgi:hypothetical protein